MTGRGNGAGCRPGGNRRIVRFLLWGMAAVFMALTATAGPAAAQEPPTGRSTLDQLRRLVSLGFPYPEKSYDDCPASAA